MTVTYKNGLIIDEAAVGADVTSFVIDSRGSDGCGITYKWTGTLVGSFSLECLDDGNIAQPATGTWVGWIPVNGATFNSTITTGGGSDEDSFATTYHRYYRIVFTYSSGTGDLAVALNAG